MLPVLWMTKMNIWTTVKVCLYPYCCNGITKSDFPGIDVREHGAKGWVPVPLRSWFWIPFITLIVLLAMGLELALYFTNKNEGGCATRLSFRSYWKSLLFRMGNRNWGVYEQHNYHAFCLCKFLNLALPDSRWIEMLIHIDTSACRCGHGHCRIVDMDRHWD